MKRKLLISVLTAVILVCVCALTGCSGKTTEIDLKEYVSVSFTGLNGSGTAEVNINSEAIRSLVNDGSAADSFAAEVENNGKLSNGDALKVTITYNEKLIENAKIKVKNAVLSFPVTGLDEKATLDVFANVSFEVSGPSSKCVVSVKYNDKDSNGMFVLKTESGEIIKETTEEAFGVKITAFNKQFKDGDKVTLQISDESLEKLGKEYLISEKSREYTIQSDNGKWLMELTEEKRKELDKTAINFADEKINAAIQNTDRASKVAVVNTDYGDAFTVIDHFQIDELKIKNLNKAYVGTVQALSSSEKTRYVYYIYDADLSYHYEMFDRTYNKSASCTLIVKITDPQIASSEITYSEISFDAAKDLASACDEMSITSNFEEMP